MVKFGLIEEWVPEAGTVTSWIPTADSRRAAAAAPIHPVPPSHIQAAYLESAHNNRDAGFRFSRLCTVTFDIPGELDKAAMATALTRFVRRHDTFRSWFATDKHGIVRHTLTDAEQIELDTVDVGVLASADEIRDHVQQTTPGPDVWDCFSFGTIEREGSFTVYLAMDHLVTDGISQAIEIYEVRQLYRNAISGVDEGIYEPGSYIDYCARERAASAELTLSSPLITQWVEIVQANGGDLPTFPLDLGKDGEGYTRTSDASFPMLDGEQAARVDAACEAVGAKFSGAVFVAAAIAQYELTGKTSYLGLTPKSTRTTPGEWTSVGWFSSLVPVHFEVSPTATFLELATLAQQAFNAGKGLGDTSYHRVLELVTPEMGITTQPGWTVPMVSYVDVRKLPGAADLEAAKVGLFGSRGSSEEVFMWINRFDESTSATFLYPGTEVANAAIKLYFDTIAKVFTSVADSGDYLITPAPSLASAVSGQ